MLTHPVCSIYKIHKKAVKIGIVKVVVVVVAAAVEVVRMAAFVVAE